MQSPREVAAAPLPPIYGYTKMPAFLFRIGSHPSLKKLAAAEALLWGTIYGRQVERRRPYAVPCLQTKAQLAKTIRVSERTTTNYLASLRRVALLFELPRGRERNSRRQRSTARWALNPFEIDVWRPKVEAQIADIAEHDGKSSRWYQRAIGALDLFQARSELLASRILVDIGIDPKVRRRSKSRKRNSYKRSRKNLPASQNLPGRVVFTPPDTDPISMNERPDAAVARKEPPIGGSTAEPESRNISRGPAEFDDSAEQHAA